MFKFWKGPLILWSYFEQNLDRIYEWWTYLQIYSVSIYTSEATPSQPTTLYLRFPVFFFYNQHWRASKMFITPQGSITSSLITIWIHEVLIPSTDRMHYHDRICVNVLWVPLQVLCSCGWDIPWPWPASAASQPEASYYFTGCHTSTTPPGLLVLPFKKTLNNKLTPVCNKQPV